MHFNLKPMLMQNHMKQADVASATRETMMNSSPVFCTSPVGSVDLCQECPSPDEIYCFDLRCFVQPLPVITSQMLQTLADDTESDNESVFEAINKAEQFPRNAGQTAILSDCYKPQSKPKVSKQKLNGSMFVSVTPPILAEKQSMPFDHFNESDACEDGTCTVTTPLSKERKVH